jgi:hypothetical protein
MANLPHGAHGAPAPGESGAETSADALSETLGGRPDAGEEARGRAAGFVWTLLPRHGKRPARFLGREMLRADNRAAARGGHVPFWSDIQIYELYTGGFVTAVRHFQADDDHTCWQDTWFSQEAGAVIVSLRNHGSAGVWADCAQGVDMAARLAAWLGLVRAVFGEAKAA